LRTEDARNKFIPTRARADCSNPKCKPWFTLPVEPKFSLSSMNTFRAMSIPVAETARIPDAPQGTRKTQDRIKLGDTANQVHAATLESGKMPLVLRNTSVASKSFTACCALPGFPDAGSPYVCQTAAESDDRSHAAAADAPDWENGNEGIVCGIPLRFCLRRMASSRSWTWCHDAQRPRYRGLGAELIRTSWI